MSEKLCEDWWTPEVIKALSGDDHRLRYDFGTSDVFCTITDHVPYDAPDDQEVPEGVSEFYALRSPAGGLLVLTSCSRMLDEYCDENGLTIHTLH